MVRRSPTRRGGAADEPVPSQESDYLAGQEPGRRNGPWSGGGGRWWVWVGRVFLWAVLLVILVNGIWLPLRDGLALPGVHTADSGAEDQEETAQFPESAAAAFALRFAEVYLSVPDSEDTDDDADADLGDASQAQERTEELAEFVPEGQTADYDVPADSEMDVSDLHILGVEASGAHDGVVHLAMHLNDTPMRLDVPVYTEGTSLVVTGQPALLAAPETVEPPEPESVEVDSEAREELETDLAEFFESYAGGDLPERYLDDEASVTPLPEDALEFVELEEVVVPHAAAGEGTDVRQAHATVVWEIPDSGESAVELTQGYALTVVRDGTEWNVRDIQGAPHSFFGS